MKAAVTLSTNICFLAFVKGNCHHPCIFLKEKRKVSSLAIDWPSETPSFEYNW